MSNVLLPLFFTVTILLSVAGWFTNVLWTFEQADGASLVLGLAGIFVPFIGAAHGVWLWF